MKRHADGQDVIPAIPPVRDPVEVRVAVARVAVDARDARVAVLVQPYARYHPEHCPSNTLRAVSHLETSFPEYPTPSIFMIEQIEGTLAGNCRMTTILAYGVRPAFNRPQLSQNLMVRDHHELSRLLAEESIPRDAIAKNIAIISRVANIVKWQQFG